MKEETAKRREERKQSMICGFIRAFCEEGLDGAYVSKLTAAAGVSEALLYRYFENRDDVIRQCTIQYHEQIEKDLTEIIIRYLDSPDLMPGKILEYIDGVMDICRFLLQVMAHPAYCAMMEDSERQVAEHIIEVADLFEEKRRMDRNTAVGAAFLLNSIVNDYILKKSRESFFTQFGAIRLLIWRT